MGTIATIATIVLAISFMVFVAFFGRIPAFRRTPIAWLYRAIWVYIPNGVLALDQRLTSGKLTSSLRRFGHFMMNDKHPTILIFYFLLLSVSQCLSLPSAWPDLGLLQKTTLAVAMVLPYLFLYLAAFSDPGIIKPENVSYHLSLYPYDFTLFHPGAACRTCETIKPARSKHCPICKCCIARLDHHCIFINNCVGAGNQHWFLLLLFSTGVLTLYGGSLGAHLIAAQIKTRNPAWGLIPWTAGNLPIHDWLLMWTWGLQDRVGLGSVSMLALLTSPLVWGLLVYNLYNVYCGVSTNESLKWGDWGYEMADGYAFKRRMTADRPKDPRYEAAWTRWPVETEQILVRTEDGQPPPAGNAVFAGEGEWERVWHLRDVENLYDIGLWDNLVDIFVPGHQFKGKDLPTAEVTGRRRKKPNRQAVESPF